MGKISSYGIDGTPSSNDKWVGTDGLTGQTKNFNAEGLAATFNKFGLIGIGGQIPFTFFVGDISERPEGSISLISGIGDFIAFSSVTSLVISNKASSGNLATEYINYLNAGNVLIYDLSNINNFAKFSVTSIVVRPSEPTFFDVSLTFVEGNGSFDQTRIYGLIESGAAISNHNSLQNVGTNTHAQIDAHIANVTTNPHSVTKTQVGLPNADNTSDADKPVSTAAQAALDGKVDDAQVLTDVPSGALFTDTIYDSTAVDTHIADTTNPHSVTKAQVGLPNADNTSDADKPVSTAAQSALDGKVDDAQVLTDVPSGALFTDTIYDSTAVDAHIADVTTNPHSVTKTQVGLGNADNTSDANKPVSTAAQSALDLKSNLASPTFTGTVTVADLHIDSTGALEMPTGTDGNRPTPVAGMFRFNTTSLTFEGYDGTAWGAIGGSVDGGATIVKDDFNGDNSTTAFTLSVSPISTLFTSVYIAGVYQEKETYSITGSTLNFTTAPPNGGSIEVISLVSNNISPSANTITRDDFTGVTAQTDFTLSTAPPSIDFMDVYVNGAYQNKDTYTLVGTTLSFSEAPDAGDAIETMIISTASLVTAVSSVNGQTGAVVLNNPFVISTSTAAIAGSLYVLTADLTLTLPSSPINGESVKISNLSGVATCIVGRNGNNIMGLAQDLTLDNATASFEFVYSGATKGWIIIGL